MQLNPVPVALALIGLGIGGGTLLLVPQEVPGASLGSGLDMTSPGFFPVLAALLVLAASLALIPEALAPASPGQPHRPTLPLAQGALLIAGALLAPVLGGLLVIFLLMVAFAVLAGARRPVPVLLVAGLSVLVVHLLFERLLKVMLPPGILFA